MEPTSSKVPESISSFQTLSPGDRFWECDYGMCYECLVVTPVIPKTEYWENPFKRFVTQFSFMGLVGSFARPNYFMQTEGMTHYGPDIYTGCTYSACFALPDDEELIASRVAEVLAKYKGTPGE